MDDRARQCNSLGFPERRRGGAIDAGGSSMSATKAMVDGGVTPDRDARVMQARGRTTALLRVADAAAQLEVAAISLEEGALTAEVRRRIGLATLLTKAVGRRAG